MTDCLFKPDYRLVRTFACVIRLGRVFGDSRGLPGGREWKDHQECVNGTWDEGEKVRVGEGVDVVELEGR